MPRIPEYIIRMVRPGTIARLKKGPIGPFGEVREYGIGLKNRKLFRTDKIGEIRRIKNK